VAGDGPSLERIDFVAGAPLERDVLFIHPQQRQIDLVGSLGLVLNSAGYVQVDGMTRETSVPGIYAAGDLVTQMQGAMLAAASGLHAAAALHRALAMELAARGELR
jgi:thioredoxin reductase